MEAHKKLMIVWMLSTIVNAMFANGMTICNMTREERKACEPYVTASNITLHKPSRACCSATANADISCICSYKDSNLLYFYGIDPKQALELPRKCKLKVSVKC
ncbi:hypothetical protein TSUD_63260 [Trifolium subterraneum]|uniref:Bifunctional inhibitor/plant lipid transfer protein/seed storage helical domain-containing protein n=1 Tax=Trifolium subterraneum TaxID=3900 RepID=A0A2Z6N4A3_TRISU|nr:hypothetical protein TSUD_63260 [Trifolium subterraneum]